MAPSNQRFTDHRAPRTDAARFIPECRTLANHRAAPPSRCNHRTCLCKHSCAVNRSLLCLPARPTAIQVMQPLLVLSAAKGCRGHAYWAGEPFCYSTFIALIILVNLVPDIGSTLLIFWVHPNSSFFRLAEQRRLKLSSPSILLAIAKHVRHVLFPH